MIVNFEKNNPLVSIITPTYNRGSYLDETIQSVLNQDYPHIEYIVLDDGSTDNTKEVLEKYAGKLTRETHSNMGETRTVNKGWSMSHGEIVTVVSSDDPLLPGAISSAVDFMQVHPDVLVAYPDWNVIDQHSKLIEHIQALEFNYLYMLKHHKCTPGPGTFIRRKAFEMAGMRDPQFKYVADFEYWLRLGLIGKFARIPKTLATSRRHPGAASLVHQGAIMANEHIRVIEKIYSLPNLPPQVRKVRAEAFNVAHYVATITAGKNHIEALKHFVIFILYHPQSYFRNIDKLGRILYVLLPKPLFNALLKVWHNILPTLVKLRSLRTKPC